MKGLLIKTDQQLIEDIELPNPTKVEADIKNLLEELYLALLIDKGSRLVEQVQLYLDQVQPRLTRNVLLVDEEGRLRRTTRAIGGFTIHGKVFFGRGIVLSEEKDSEGDTTWAAPHISLPQLQDIVRFFDERGRPYSKR